MLEKLCFDIAAIVILFILGFVLYYRKSVEEKAGKILFSIIIITVISSAADILANYNNGNVNMESLNYFCTCVYHISRCASLYLYAQYILLTTETWYFMNDKLVMFVKHIPLCVCSVFVIASVFTHFSFYYLNGYYTRGTGFIIIYICDVLYFIQAISIILQGIKVIGYRRAASLASCVFLTCISAVIQFNFPYLYVDIIGFTLSLLFIVLFIDNPDEKVDGSTLLKKNQTYTSDIKNLFHVSRPFDIIHITVRNNKEISEMLSYSYYLDFKKTLSDKLKDIIRTSKINCETYYIREGKYRVVLYENNLSISRELADKICSAFNGEIKVNDSNISVLATVSITQCPQDFSNVQELLAFGKSAQMFEKIGQVMLTKDVMSEDKTSLKSHIDKYIERGLLEGGFKVFYQPVYNSNTKNLDEAEATVRLLDREEGLIDPEYFISSAEQNGSIIEIGLFILDDVCRFVSSEEFEETGIRKVNIKVSVVQCIQKGFADKVISIMEKYKVRSERINFEISESLASDNQKTFEENINALLEYGIDIILDDYGSGYSNIITLATQKIKAIKFGRTFIESQGNERVKVILENSIEMVKSFGKEIIIDGVDKEEDIERFIELGCDKIQGRFNNLRPMPENMLCMFYAELENGSNI